MAARHPDPGPVGVVPAAGLHLSLERAADPAFQRRDWRAQRVGRGLVAAFVAAAALGVSGPGFWSRTQLRSPDGALSIHTHRVLHQHAPAEWLLAAARPIHRLHLAGEALASFEIGPLGPGASWRSGASGELMLEFGEPLEGELAIPVTPREPGRVEARFRADDGPVVSLSHLVLP